MQFLKDCGLGILGLVMILGGLAIMLVQEIIATPKPKRPLSNERVILGDEPAFRKK